MEKNSKRGSHLKFKKWTRIINMVWQLQNRCHTDVLKKKDNVPTMTEFIKILDCISHDDKTGHLFTVDIKFYNINEKALLFNEIYPPIFQKNKKIDPFERSTLQLMSVIIRNEEKDKINTFTYNSKTHSTLKEKSLFLCMLKTFTF